MRETAVQTPARLALEDGTLFRGSGFGSSVDSATAVGEVVFNTALCGYQEALTDPSYAGQILVMTNPLIGNYGITDLDVESDRPQVAGFVVRELSRMHSNFRATQHLHEWLRHHGVPGIAGIDTRALVKRLRTAGVMRGGITGQPSSTLTDQALLAETQAAEQMIGRNLALEVGCRLPLDWNTSFDPDDPFGEISTEPNGPRVVAFDCGSKRNILRHLASRGCNVRLIPLDTTAKQIRELQPDGVFISNGPGDPAAIQATVQTLRSLRGEYPMFGICLGHQLLALAHGAKTFKLKFGHRGTNQPVRNLLTGRIEITSQNHGFCVDRDSLSGAGLVETHTHLNDGTVAGFQGSDQPVLAVQFHPEASPGPHDSSYLFDWFCTMMRVRRPLSADEADALQLAVVGGSASASAPSGV